MYVDILLEDSMKKSKVIYILFIIVFILSSCYDPRITFKSYPWYKADTWYCEEIDMTIKYEFDENRKRTGATFSELTIDGVTHSVAVVFHSGTILFLAYEDGERLKEKDLDGSWCYREGNLVVEVNSENILNGKYSELVFVPVRDSK